MSVSASVPLEIEGVPIELGGSAGASHTVENVNHVFRSLTTYQKYTTTVDTGVSTVERNVYAIVFSGYYTISKKMFRYVYDKLVVSRPVDEPKPKVTLDMIAGMT